MAILYQRIERHNFSDFGVTGNPALPGDISFRRGAAIEEPLPSPLVFEVDYPPGEEPPHLLGNVIPVFSDRLVRALRAAGADNFEAFPAILRNPATGATWDKYWAVNVLGIVAWANLQESEYDTIMEGDPEGVTTPLLGFHTIVLDAKKTRDDLLMFRLAESPSALLIHDRVFDYLVANRPQGGWRFDAIDVDVR
jgi:hypothetical protein